MSLALIVGAQTMVNKGLQFYFVDQILLQSDDGIIICSQSLLYAY